AIARAILRQPNLLILDEPTTHLDRIAINDLFINLKRLPNSPAILLISHDEIIVDLCRRVLELQNHKLTVTRSE
ncbi:MAG: ABC transporter ATP-binding protein, partial [Candidatus Neomarinimicrobiota bacterium]